MNKKFIYVLLVMVIIASMTLVACAQTPAAKPAQAGTPAATSSTAAPAKVIKWKMSSTWTPSLKFIEADYYFAEKVKEMSGGRMEITYYPAGEIVPAFELFDAVSKGTLDAGGEGPVFWAGKNTAFDVICTFAFGMGPVDYYVWVYHGGGMKIIQDLYGKYGIHYVPTGVSPMESGFRTNKPIKTLDDFKGLTLRTVSGQVLWILEQIGAKPVKTPGGEIYMALKLGTIDGAELNCPSIDWGSKLQEVTKYWALPGWHQPTSLLGVMVNQKSWDALPDDLKAIVEMAGQATMVWSYGNLQYDNIQAVQKWKEAGVTITYMDDASLQKLEELSMRYVTEQAAKNPDYANAVRSMMQYAKGFAAVRDIEGPFGFGRNMKIYPTLP